MAFSLNPLPSLLGASPGPPVTTPGSAANNPVLGTTPTVLQGTTTTSSGIFSGLFDLYSSRLIAIVLGLICIIGAILLYLGEDIAGAVKVATKAVT